MKCKINLKFKADVDFVETYEVASMEEVNISEENQKEVVAELRKDLADELGCSIDCITIENFEVTCEEIEND